MFGELDLFLALAFFGSGGPGLGAVGTELGFSGTGLSSA